MLGQRKQVGTQIHARLYALLYVVALSLYAPRSAAAEPATENRVLLVSAASSDRHDAETDAFLERVDDAIITGMRVATNTKRSRYAGALTVQRMKAVERTTVVPALRELESFTTAGLEDEIERARTPLPKHAKLDIVQVVARRVAPHDVRVDLELYAIDTQLRLKAIKSVGGCGEGEAIVLDQLRFATEEILTGSSAARPPEPIVVVSPAAPLTVGTVITIDGCKSVSNGYDALTYTWRQVGDEPQRVLPSSFAGRSFSFLAEREGTYQFTLQLKKVMSEEEVAASTSPPPVKVEVYRKPEAQTGDDKIVAALGESVHLEGATNLGDAAKFCWRQIAGPSLLSIEALTEKAPTNECGGCAAKSCAFVPKEPGLYAFELEASRLLKNASGGIDSGVMELTLRSRCEARTPSSPRC